jgi:nitroimidazol reductase NimA-like FMN-containing flavoprotein (pyridoxamine 5'-phosphate oxidase superfamily)
VTDPAHDGRAFAVTSLNRVRRYGQRGHYDRPTVFGILDDGLVAHVAFVHHGRPVVIPMAYGHDAERLFLHGARTSRIGVVTAGEPVSVGVTRVDGIVVARSLYDSSMNYRAVVIHGRAAMVDDATDRLHALRCIVEHYTPGRWEELLPPTAQELKATMVLAVCMESASAKVRTGLAVDHGDAKGEGVWSGVVPVMTTLGAPVTDAHVSGTVEVPASVQRLVSG